MKFKKILSSVLVCCVFALQLSVGYIDVSATTNKQTISTTSSKKTDNVSSSTTESKSPTSSVTLSSETSSSVTPETTSSIISANTNSETSSNVEISSNEVSSQQDTTEEIKNDNNIVYINRKFDEQNKLILVLFCILFILLGYCCFITTISFIKIKHIRIKSHKYSSTSENKTDITTENTKNTTDDKSKQNKKDTIDSTSTTRDNPTTISRVIPNIDIFNDTADTIDNDSQDYSTVIPPQPTILDKISQLICNTKAKSELQKNLQNLNCTIKYKKIDYALSTRLRNPDNIRNNIYEYKIADETNECSAYFVLVTNNENQKQYLYPNPIFRQNYNLYRSSFAYLLFDMKDDVRNYVETNSNVKCQYIKGAEVNGNIVTLHSGEIIL